MGISVVPFKAQNMSNNVALVKDGIISRAQWLQARACNVCAETIINPIVIKPQPNLRSKLLLRGKQIVKSYVYPGNDKLRTLLRHVVLESVSELLSKFELVIMEGAGSISEINLCKFDVCNMWLARALNCDTILITDIDKGGALASILGSKLLLEHDSAKLVKGFIINKFVGDLSLLRSGIKTIQTKTKWECFGVLPFFEKCKLLPTEDSLFQRTRSSKMNLVGIVIDLPYISDVDEYDALKLETGFELLFMQCAPICVSCNVRFVIIPDTDDLFFAKAWLINHGWLKFLMLAQLKNVLILGICAGFYLICEGIEIGFSLATKFSGFKLLKANIALSKLCWKREVRCRCALFDCWVSSYVSNVVLLNSVNNEPLFFEGKVMQGLAKRNTLGSNLSGLFVNDDFRNMFLIRAGLQPSFICYFNQLDFTISVLSKQVQSLVSSKAIKYLKNARS